MVNFKKLLPLTILVCLMMNPIVAKMQVEDESGRMRVTNIMSNEETGIGAYNKKNVHYAETLNIAKDLNIFFPNIII